MLVFGLKTLDFMAHVRERAYPPPPPCKSNTKIPKFDGNITSCCSDKGVVCERRAPVVR